MKTVGVRDYTQITQSKNSKVGVDVIMSKFNTSKNITKILSNMQQKGGAHLQCVNNHIAKFEYKGMKTFRVTDYTNQIPKHFRWKKNV